MHGDNAESSALHLYCRHFMRQGLWFALEDLYCSYYATVRGGVVGRGRSDADVDANTYVEGEAREGGGGLLFFPRVYVPPT